MHISFNITLHHFLVNKAKDDDEVEVVREYDELRPMDLKITSNKAIGGVCNRQLRKPLAKVLTHAQRSVASLTGELPCVTSLTWTSHHAFTPSSVLGLSRYSLPLTLDRHSLPLRSLGFSLFSRL